MRQVVVKDDFFYFLQIDTSKLITFFKDLQDFSGFCTYISKLPKNPTFQCFCEYDKTRLLCGTCWKQLYNKEDQETRHCPTCNGEVIEARDHVLERILEDLPWSDINSTGFY